MTQPQKPTPFMLLSDDAISLYRYALYGFPLGFATGFMGSIGLTAVRQFPLRAAFRQSVITGLGFGVLYGFYSGACDLERDKKNTNE